MPNQYNFRSDVTTPTSPLLFASRVVKFPEEGVLLEEIPASFGFSPENNIELHFYTIPNNVLLLSTVISLSDNLALENGETSRMGINIAGQDGLNNGIYPIDEPLVANYIVNDNSDDVMGYRNFIRINYTKLFEEKQITILPGDYKVTLNFFENEIGNYYDRKMYISKISPSRSEVELAFVDNTNTNLENNNETLREFILPSLPKPFAIGASELIYTSGMASTDPEDPNFDDDAGEGINYEKLITVIENTFAGSEDIRRLKNLGSENLVKVYIEEAIKNIHEKMVIKLLNADYRIQESEFELFINEILDESCLIGYTNLVTNSFNDTRIILE